MAYEGFDWKGYLAYAGYPENEIPENVTDEELAQIRDHWARTVYQEELAIAAQDPFLETKKEREEAARDKLLALAPEYRQAFGLKEAQPAEAAFSADEFREHVLNNPVQDAPLDYYLKTFTAKRIGKNTKYEYPYLEGLTKKDFQDLFMERNGIDPDLTTVEHIRNGEFGPAWMAQRAEEESNLPKGSAMRQGWLTFKKLTGLTTETFGDALGIEWMRNIGKGITENAIKTIEEEGYRSKYGESLVDTFKAQGPFAAAGKVLEMAQENWATTGVPLALAGMSALFGIAARNPRLAAQGLAGARASLAAATSADVAMGTGAAATVGRVGASTIAKSLAFASALASGLEVGATREELEEQSKKTGKQLYDPSDPSDVVAWGLLSAALDHVGNMMTFVGGGGLVRAAKGLVQSQQTRMIGAAEAAIRQAGREAGKSWGRKVVEAMGTEGITEALQEYANIMPARNKGVEYTPKEIRDRMIDAGAVGAFMGGGMRGVQALTERKPRTQSESESDTTTPQQPTQTQTPPPNVPSAPNQPPPPGFNVASNTNYAEIEGGYAAWDGYNTGYGNTKEEASQAIIDQSNKNKDTIDPANVTSTANESRVSFGNGGEIVVTGNGHKKVIGDIISLHNANDNVVNLDGTKTHNFDATTLSGLSVEALRNRIEHSGKTAIPDTRSVRKARADQVDIAINYRGEKRDSNGNLIGYRAELVLDDATRNQLAAKGYRILGSQFNNDVQTVQLYRDGQIYRIELTTNGNEVSSTLFTKKILGNLDARVESELSTQKHRITDVGGVAKEVQNFLSVSSAVRSGGIQIERTGAGADAKFVNRKALENFVKKQGGKVVKSTDRSITYELGGETLRLDLQANGDVVVSRNGRFLGAYQFDGSDLGNGMERATYDLTNDVAPVTRFSAQDVYEGLGYRRASNRSQNVLFVKDNESGDYYVIKVSNKGKVDAVVVPYDPNGFFARLEALDSMSTIEDVRQVYQDQFRSGYVEFVDFGGGNLGMRSRITSLMTDDINDVQMLTSDEVDDIINNPTNPNYNPRLMENLVKVVGISQYTSSTSTTPARIVDWVTVDDVAGVRAFIERAKGYGAIIADYDSTGNNISVKGKAWNAPGSFNADAAGLGLTDLYEEDYLNFDPDVHIDNLAAQGTATARAEIEEDIKKVAKATRKAFKDMRDLLSRSSTYLPSVTNADIGIIESAYRSTFNRLPRNLNATAQKAKDIRRHFYRARLLQARLHIDVLMANPEFYANRVIEAELRRLQAYDPNWSNDEVRFAAAEAEEIALRLEEGFLNLREMQVSTSISRQIWDAIYPGDSGVEYGSFIERIHNQGNDFRFSRDVNAPRAERHMSLLDELRNHPFIGNGALSDLIDSGKLVLLETQQEIEDALLREGQAVPKFDQLGNIQGFASNDNMRVYLSSWGIKQGDAFRVLLHEMGAHTRRFGFSEAEFQEILAGIKANSTAQTPEGRHIRHAMWRAQNAKVSPNDPHYWEEVAAYLVEDSNEYAGLGMLDTMQAWVKRWLFTNGYIDATNFHYQDFTIFSLGMLRDSRIPLRLLNGKFDYSRHQNRIYDTRKFVESYVTEDIAKQLGYSREEVIEMVAAHLAGTYKAGNHVIGDLPDEDELMSHFPTIDADWRASDRDTSASDLRFSRDMETAIAEARDEVLRPYLPPAGVQKDASVIYPNMGEEISNFRYSIGKKAREEYRTQLERGREDLSPDEIENILNDEVISENLSTRFSIAQQPTTPEQGTAIPNAPGMYKMRNGTIQAHPEYIPTGLETETAIYAAVAISDIAKNEPGLEDVRAMINADEVLREEVLAELSQRGIEDTRDNEFLYAIRNVLQTREPEDPTYQAIVDVFHDAITKATGGIQDDILLTDSDIAAAAHAITNTPFEPLIGEPVPTVPTPKPTVFDQIEANWAMMQSTIDEAVANTEVSERETPIIRYSIAGVDMRLDGVEGYNGVDGRQKLYAELEQIYGSTHQWNEWDSFYNQLAAAQITGTREVHDVGALAAPADSNRGLVDQFLNAALPDYLKDKIQIEWTMTPDAVKNLNGGLASFDPRGGAADKLIYIQGWGRTVGQVIRSAAWELSRFGWNAAPGAMTNLKKPLVELYNLHESAIYQELSPYYTKYKINRANVSDKHKIFLVQTYFAKMNQDILTGNPNALAQQIGIDPATYRRIHDEIIQNVNTATTNLTNYIKNYSVVSTDQEIAKAFTQDILRLIMGGMHGRGAAFVYETANSAGPSDTIYAYTNDFGLHRKFLKPECDNGKNRYACIADEIKQNLKWWRETFEPWGLGELAENFCRFFLRNFPMHNGLSFLHLNVPSAHLGDTTITKATSLISRIWQRVDDPHGIEIREKLKVMERIHAILRDHNYDTRWTENATNGYEALFRSLGITDEKSIATAQLADRALPDLQAMIQRNAAEIRADFAMTIDSLVTHMSTSRSIPEREITNMIQRMNNYAESFLGDYEHRTYEAYSLDGLDELIAMKHDLNIDPNTGELTIHAKAAAAQKFISDTEQRLGGRNAEFYKQTEEARNIVRRASRLDSLRKYKQAKITNSHRGLTGGELDERVIKEMNDELGKLIDDVREMRTADRGIYKKFNYIPGAKRRKLDERIEADREYMNFLGRVTDPLMNAIYSIDQQKKILEKLHFNRELGEHIISSGMGEIRGDAVSSSVGEGTIKDISTLEGGTFLEYIRVYPEFQKEINAEYRINSKVRDSVLGGVIDVWKANNTIYSLRLGINNYVGNFSMLLASGHLWRFANIFQAGQITKRQFLERFTTNVNGLDATTQELYEEMRSARVVGGTMSEMNVMAYGRGVHEKVIGFFLKHLRDADVLSSQGKFVAETWVNSFLEKMKTFYAFGDEWVKPLMYLNNRANAIAKWESKLNPNAPEFEGDVTEWRKEVRRRAIEEAAEQTVRESVSWENSPQFIRWLSQKNLRIFTPDFLMHNFQMLRITASNFLRLGECFRELNSLEVNNERDANYKDALVKEIAQRGVGGAMTTAVYAGLMGATGSVMALVPYMINVLFNNIEGEGDDDDKKGMFFGPDEWEGAQRLINYKTGGNNLFVPVFKSGDKIYAWNYVRSSVMLTHAPVRPPTDDPTFTDYGAVIMRNIVDLSNGTMTQQLINNMMGKDRFGREIGIVEGWGRVLERTLVPGFARQLAGVTLGYPLSDNMFHEGRAIKIPDLLGITVNAYDPRDVANHLAYDINSHNTDRNIHRRNFVEQLSKSDRLSDRQIVGMIADMRERNARDLSKANYVVTGLRQVGMTDQEIVHWLTHNRKTGGDALARKHAVGLLKGKDIYDEALITTLVNKRKQLNEGQQNLRMSKDELAVVNANLDKAIRMYKQALRVQ